MTIILSDLGLAFAWEETAYQENEKPEDALWKSSIYAKVVT